VCERRGTWPDRHRHADPLYRHTGEQGALVTEVPLARLGRSEELADAIVFIGSDAASYLTGHVLNVDGGHSAN